MLDRRTFIKSTGVAAALLAMGTTPQIGSTKEQFKSDATDIVKFIRGEKNSAIFKGYNFDFIVAAEQLCQVRDMEEYYYKAYLFERNDDGSYNSLTCRAFYQRFSVGLPFLAEGTAFMGSEDEVANREAFVNAAFAAHEDWLRGDRPWQEYNQSNKDWEASQAFDFSTDGFIERA
jgi:hypothetical protein